MKALKDITLADVKNIMAAKGYEIFTANGVPNIVGIRSTERDGIDYDDTCFVWWTIDGKEEVHQYTITTNPGDYYLKNPIKGTNGTLILCPGQHKNCWQIGYHKGKQLAFVQTGAPVRVFRDANKDSKLDFDPKSIEIGYFGMNGHHGSLNDVNVIGQWSAGCQVWRYSKAHQKMMKQVQENEKKYDFDKISYTLLVQEDFLT